MTFVILFTYISASPFIIQKIYGMTAIQFSWMFAGIGITLIISSQLTGYLVDFSTTKIDERHDDDSDYR